MDARLLTRTATALLLALLLACQGDRESERGSLCPSCVPQLGGETGDFGGTPTPCEGVSAPVAIARDAAVALGFDVEELERRIARPIALPMHWTPSLIGTGKGEPASGFEADTQLTAQLVSTGTFQHVRPDPGLCNGTTCQIRGVEVEQASCGDRLELFVHAQVQTLDGALQATTEGMAVRTRAASDGSSSSFVDPYFVTHVALDVVTGKLRLRPEPGAAQYRTWLTFEGRLHASDCEGTLSPNVLVEAAAGGASLYSPIYGVFPPTSQPAAAVDAGAPRSP